MRPFKIEIVKNLRMAVALLWAGSFGAGFSASAAAQSLGADRPRLNGPLSVQRAVAIGLLDNLMIRAAQSDVRASAAETRVARSRTRLQLSSNSYLAYGDSSNILGTTPDVMPQNVLAVPPRGVADQNLTLSVPLYTGGRLEHLVHAAAAREQATNADAGGVRAEVALKIKESYYRALLFGEIARAAQARREAATELVRTTQAQFAAGKGLEASIRRVEAEQADADRALTTAENLRAKALLDLKATLGVRLDSDITLSDSLSYRPPSGDLATSLAEAARKRPELASARARLASAQHQTGAARGAQGVQLYGMAMADGFTAQPSGARGGYTLGLVASLPLLDGGERRSETAQARAQEERATAELHDLELRIANEVQQAWLDVETAGQNYRTAQAALRSAQTAYEITALRVQNLKSLLVEQLDALAALTQARSNLAQALYDHSVAVAQLERTTTGVGTDPATGGAR